MMKIIYHCLLLGEDHYQVEHVLLVIQHVQVL